MQHALLQYKMQKQKWMPQLPAGSGDEKWSELRKRKEKQFVHDMVLQLRSRHPGSSVIASIDGISACVCP